MKNLLFMQENEFSGATSMYPSTMQPLYTHLNKLVTSNFQICFPAPYLSLQLLSKIFIDSDFCHNYLHTLYLFECL